MTGSAGRMFGVWGLAFGISILMHFEPWQWALLALGAAFAGFSKTGIPGLGILSVAIFANLMPARQSTGLVLPLLIFADVFAYFVYRKNLNWARVGRLLPWALGGIVAGWFVLRQASDLQTARIVGAVIAVMLGLHLWRKWRGTAEAAAAHAPGWFGPFAGVMAGFATMVANAAGPVMALYLLAMRLPKLEFLGTGAAFFLVINWIKVPFGLHLGILNVPSLTLNLWLLPAVAAGALAGPWVVKRVNQRVFENAALVLAAAAAVKLLFF
jgi:uncharacterized membrane protein YfcA